MKWSAPPQSLRLPLPLWVTATPTLIAAKAVRVRSPAPGPKSTWKQIASEVVTEYLIGPWDMELIYMSPDPYSCAFEASLDLRKCDISHHRTGDLWFITKNGCLILTSMDLSTPGARLDKWRTKLRGAWLISINGCPVSTIADVQREILTSSMSNPSSCTLLFFHPKLPPTSQIKASQLCQRTTSPSIPTISSTTELISSATYNLMARAYSALDGKKSFNLAMCANTSHRLAPYSRLAHPAG
jgi:hypothetical protein